MRASDFVDGPDTELAVGASISSAPPNGDSDAHNSESRQTHLAIKESHLSPPSTFETGTANSEDFRREILYEMPMGHTRSGITPGTPHLRSTAFFIGAR